MCIFKVSYLGEEERNVFEMGNIYDVQKVVREDDGRVFFVIEGVEGKHDIKSFHKLERKGLYYLRGKKLPEVGDYMRLAHDKNSIREIMTGEVKLIEKGFISGRYFVYTEKCVYDVCITE